MGKAFIATTDFTDYTGFFSMGGAQPGNLQIHEQSDI